jgi:hypothetical protein
MKTGSAELSVMRSFPMCVKTDNVEWLQYRLEAADIRVWRDTADLWPGEGWRAKVRRAIQDNALVFIACFSDQNLARRSRLLSQQDEPSRSP